MPGAAQNPTLVRARVNYNKRYNEWVKVAGWGSVWTQWKNFGQDKEVFSRASNAGVAKKKS